nr:hypothetical protein GCM10020063_015340 [Dactylosporangium thailandense]
MAGDGCDLDDVLVLISTKWGDCEVALTAWMADGPGPRDATRPESARSRSTGEALPLTVIPLAYRNDRESRALIAAGRIAPPWRNVPWNAGEWGKPPCEVYGPRPFDRSVPESADAAHSTVRRLAGEARWEELDAVVQQAAAELADVAAVLCEVLESDARPPRPGHLIDALGRLRYDDAAELLESLVGQFAYADGGLPDARRCIRALAAIDKPNSRVRLTLISWRDWPGPIQRWAAQELRAKGQYIAPPGG